MLIKKIFDLFLFWGSVAVKAYADYNPAIALKYVKNVLEQYSKDGLAFQRYAREKQDGQGDDILSGDSLSIVGLYQAIYGINPMYNRFYLEPHITPELAGTEINYNFRGKKLVINLDNDSYSVSDHKFKVTDSKGFGFNSTKTGLSYFNESSATASLDATAAQELSISIKNWDAGKMEWQQDTTTQVVYVLHQLKPVARYRFMVNSKLLASIKSNLEGDLAITNGAKTAGETIVVARKN